MPSSRWTSTCRAVLRPPRGFAPCSNNCSRERLRISTDRRSGSGDRGVGTRTSGQTEEVSMGRKIVIDPVTRIEGHAKITIQLDDAGEVADARFHVTEFRGFEKFCEGRPLAEMPGITARVCGICPVSHLMASAKAGDHILAVAIPPAAEKPRRLINKAQVIQSH